MSRREMYGTPSRQILHYLIDTIVILAVSAFLIEEQTSGILGGITVGNVTFYFDNMLVLLISGIVGFIPAMISFVIVFLSVIITDINQAYTVFIYLIAAVLAHEAVRLGWYRDRVVMLYFLPLVFAFILGDAQLILQRLIFARGFVDFSAMELLFSFVGELPECGIAVLLTYCFMIMLPEKYKTLTHNGFYYSERRREVEDKFTMLRASKLSRNVTTLIIVEAVVLGVAAAGFVNVLLPDLEAGVIAQTRGNIISDFFESDDAESDTDDPVDEDEENGMGDSSRSNRYEQKAKDNNTETETEAEAEAEEEESDAETEESLSAGTALLSSGNGKGHARFILNNHGLAFDLKLIMLILNTAVPFTILADNIAQRLIVAPITGMAREIRRFCDAPMEEKEVELKNIEALSVKNDDEIGELYDAVSEMAGNITSFVDQTREKEKLVSDLRIAQKSAEAKTSFLSNMSHELRTPINSVLGLDEMILRETNEKNIYAYASDIASAGKSLLGLVNDILDSSKLDAGKLEIIETEYELSSVINDLVNMTAVKAEEKGLNLHIDVDENTPHVLYGDEIRLKQVILNILSNAVKYTEEGDVSLSLGFQKLDAERVMLMVRVVDTGIGIKEEDIHKLFSRFERIEEERNRTIEGTGLGMNIVQQLLELMDSELQVRSTYGEGSEFSFALLQRVISWHPIGNFNKMYEQSLSGMSEYHESFRAPNAHILVVDDTPMNLTVVKGLLKQTRIKITTAASGPEALELVKTNSYDIIFLDQRMPHMDGIETFRFLQVQEENVSRAAPVIALTANAVSGTREMFLNEGFSDYISKPIDSSKLESVLLEYLPDNKIITEFNDDDEYEESDDDFYSSGAEEGEHTADDYIKSKVDISPLKGLASIAYDTAIVNCGSEEVLIRALSDYLEAEPQKAEEIRKYHELKDYENYTILVHALKSSSRLIGALQLSEDAAYLESCGDRAQEGDTEAMKEIDERTPALLKLYRSYYDKLTPLIFGQTARDTRPLISEEELEEGLMAIREFVQAFDFDSADNVMTMLLDYRVPEAQEERFTKIKNYLSAVDREALLSVL